MIDQSSSKISSWAVKEFRIKCTSEGREKVCIVQFQGRYPNQSIFKINGSNQVKTPKENANRTIASLFQAITLTDYKFYRSWQVDVVFGTNIVYLILDGLIKKPGLPIAQFNWLSSFRDFSQLKSSNSFNPSVIISPTVDFSANLMFIISTSIFFNLLVAVYFLFQLFNLKT